MEEQVPLAARLLVGLLLLATGAAVSAISRRAADGRLGRNPIAGIRVRATMRDDAAWRAGHQAARGPSDASAAAFAVTGLAAAGVRDAPWFTAVVLAGTGVAMAVLLVGVRRAVRAADAADGS